MQFADGADYKNIGFLLAAFKCFSFIWEYCGNSTSDKKSACFFYFSFSVLYWVAAWWPSGPLTALTVVLIVDVAISYFWESITPVTQRLL